MRSRKVARALSATRIIASVAGAMLLNVATAALASVTVSLTAPANGTTYAERPKSILLSASASAGANYTVSKVEFFDGTTLIGTDTTGPYSIAWNNPPTGNHALTAKATAVKTNSPNQTATSSAVNIFVNAPPVVTLTSPVTGTTYNIPPPSFTVSATASDSDGTVSEVDFTDCNPTPIATVTTPPYSFVFTPQPPYWFVNSGTVNYVSYTFFAFAKDNLGGVGVSGGGFCAAVFVVPTVTLTSPANGASFTAPATINLTAALGPPDAPVEKMQFYNGTTLIGEALSAPYSFSWQNVPVGTYSLTAKGIYGGGKFGQTSSPVNVTVTVGSGQVYYILPDHLNTPRLIADQAGNTVWRNDNTEPFGDSVPNGDPNNTGVVFDFPLRFPGQYFDRETNLTHNMARDYDSAIGRYVESDPIGLRGGVNTYAYVSESPLTLTDASGLAVWLCLRSLHGFPLGNHTYFYDDKTQRCCGDPGPWAKDPLNSCKEAGPKGDTCILISSNDSDTEKLLNCCNTKTNKQFYFPQLNDCHDVADDCIREIGMAPPSTPNKNRWSRCPACWRQ